MRRFTAVLLAVAGLWALSFGAPSALAVAPTVSGVKISDVTTESVTLEGDVNPQGKIITYHFEYGLADCSSSTCTATKDVKLSAGSSPIHVSEPVAGLSAGTTYHFRLVAKNGLGETKASPDRTFMTYLPPQEFAACSNDPLRRENPAKDRIEYSSANLPDCRAYEQASPVEKDGGDATGTASFVRSSLKGDAISFLSVSGVPGAVGAQDFPPYLASRGSEWSTHGLLPPAATGQQAAVLGWDAEFTDVFTKATQLGEPPQTTFMDSPGAGGQPRAIAPYISELSPDFAGASEGDAEVLFESDVAIPGVAGAIEGKSNLYIWQKASEELRLASVMNDGQAPPTGAFAGSYDWINGTTPQTLARGGAALRYYTQDTHVISSDGSAVFFTAAGSGQLYERLNPTAPQSATDGEGKCTKPADACTINLSASQRTIPDPAGTRPVAFQGASADGSRALFTSTEMLTDDANTGPEQEPARIERASKETGAGVVPDLLTTHGTAVAIDGEHIYWISPETGAIERAKLDGSETMTEFITATDNPKGLAVAGGEIYWTNAALEEGEGTIGRAKLNGEAPASGVEEDFIEGAGNPKGVAVDAEHVYWTNDHLLGQQGEGMIGRANALDGTNADAEFFVLPGIGTGTLSGIAVDGEHIYWIYSFHSSEVDRVSHISRIKLDGSEDSYTFDFVALGENVGARDLASDGAHLYWTEQRSERIGRAKLNGEGAASEVQAGFIEGANHPIGVAVDGANLYWSANGESSPNPGNDLYLYDAKAKSLSDLAPDPSSPEGINVKGVLGTSADASVVYFAANGVPDGVTGSPNARGEAAEVGDCKGILSAQASGMCNLYRYEGGQVRFIARLDSGGGADATDGEDWVPTPQGVFPEASNFQRTARVSADGQTLLFRSQRQLSDYPSKGVSQFYLYRADPGTIGCVTCNPTGEDPAAVGQASLGNIATPAVEPTPPAATLSHNLSADGKRVFFQSTDPLVGADTNGEGGCPLTGAALQKFPACTDVYEWEAAGVGSCEAQMAIAGGGCLYLISTGKGTKPQMLGDASTDGKNVFFFTRSQLVGQDEDQLQDVYDARVEGGLAAQNQPPKTPCLSTEACHGDASSGATIEAPPKFSGPGNPKPKKRCAKGKHKVKGRCVKNKKHRAKKHHAKGKAHDNGRATR